MKNKFLELHSSQDISVKEDMVLDCINIASTNQELTINFLIYDNVKLKLNIALINHAEYNKHLIINVQFIGQHAHVEASFNSLGLDHSQTFVEIKGEALKPTFSYFNIQFNGIIDSDYASIKALPRFNLATNSLDAYHGLVIGNLNDQEITYLTGRGISLKTAKYMLVTAKLFKCLEQLEPIQQEHYKQTILKLWGEHYA